MKKTYIVTAIFDNNKDVEIFEYNGLTKKEVSEQLKFHYNIKIKSIVEKLDKLQCTQVSK